MPQPTPILDPIDTAIPGYRISQVLPLSGVKPRGTIGTQNCAVVSATTTSALSARANRPF